VEAGVVAAVPAVVIEFLTVKYWPDGSDWILSPCIKPCLNPASASYGASLLAAANSALAAASASGLASRSYALSAIAFATRIIAA
jgi:hypothetical protein